ncbi:protein ANTAGONIST OF LIKE HETEROCHROMATIN PROTEIN 1-like [Vanessa cardui]|uniref:protein ANTAGONIST OF LIKE HETEROCHROMATIN PROTEIN 1-like n=1 Tax=Vanessa cardui TaxID=171605 RepID=UPI001F1322A8|nr:protein ANTAGONIST OF LIKE HETEROCHROMATIN PROTEIN 1-like [Vanessa cardui]
MEDDTSNDETLEEDYRHRRRRLIIAYFMKKKRKHRYWISQHIQSWKTSSEFNTLFNELDDENFKMYYRVSRQQFDELLTMIAKDIAKIDTNFRKAISPEERLAICLRFLATGDSYKTIGYNYRVGDRSVSRIVENVCQAVWNHLQPIYMCLPTEREWKEIAENFMLKWQFPNCIGAVDGKHISIKCPPHSGSQYFNYKHFHSVVLLAVVDANKKFIIIDIGSMGRFSDGGIFSDSAFGRRLQNNELNLPSDQPLLQGGTAIPYVFIGDQAFPLQKHFMRPYPQSACRNSREKRNFNYRLSRARNVVENAFGILSMRFRIFRRPLECKVESVDLITKAACVLHNYLSTNQTIIAFDEASAEDGSVLRSVGQLHDNVRATREAFHVRESFCNHFNNNNIN